MAESQQINNHPASGNGPGGPSDEGKLALAVNAALAQMAANSTAQEQLLRARARGGLGALLGHGADQKRNCSAWTEYGWPQNVTYDNLYWLYRREGIAFGAVEKLLGRCWSDSPEVIEGEKKENSKSKTAWESSVTPTLSAAWVWSGFADTDRRRLVGRWAGLILHIADGTTNNPSKWDEPVRQGSTEYRLDKVTPVWANALQVTEWDSDENSPTYGEPKMWQYTESPGMEGAPSVIRRIHPDRIFLLGDYKGNPIGFLEPVYNAFVSLEKVAGGSGESFLKNAARQISINYDKSIDFAALAKQYGVKPEELHQRVQQAARDLNSANDMVLVTQGANSITPLVSAVADPEPTFNVNLQTVSAGVDIPSKILVGNQTGERASTEDDAYMNKRCQGRRDRFLAPEVLDFVRHLIRVRVLPATQKMLTVMWGDLTLPTKTERLANAKTMSEINAQSLGGEGETFSRDEIREAAGYENTEPTEPLAEEDDEDGDEA